MRLKNIPWRDALDATVKTLGFVVVEEDRPCAGRAEIEGEDRRHGISPWG